jgi:hypothetical protein
MREKMQLLAFINIGCASNGTPGVVRDRLFSFEADRSAALTR